VLIMNYRKLNAMYQLYFGYQELARVLDISIDAARVTACRYVRQEFLVRLKRNVYVRRDRWDHLTMPEMFMLANVAQSPSYVSLQSALCFYDISTQIQRGYVDSIAVQRTTTIDVAGVGFSYFKVKPAVYSHFLRREDFFIATPEKAYVDAVYLTWCGNYSIDYSSLDMGKLACNRIEEIAAHYPEKFRRYLEKTYD
jgi:predicted transcriptional regulator of viral defense system